MASCFKAQALGVQALVAAAQSLSSCGSRPQSTGSVAHGISCPVAFGIFPDQGSNPCPLHWRAYSYLLDHQGSQKKKKFIFKTLFPRSHVQLFAAPWTVAHQAPLSMGFFRKEYWRGLPFPSPGDLSSPEVESWSPALQADSLPSEPPDKYKIGRKEQRKEGRKEESKMFFKISR